MNKNPMETNWKRNEFVAFTLIYASHADFDFSEDEKGKIKEIVDDETYNTLYAHFNDMTDYQALETIMSYKEMYYPTKELKNELMEKLKELFFADGEYSSGEQDLFNFLERLL